jgi:hypothetical protein
MSAFPNPFLDRVTVQLNNSSEKIIAVHIQDGLGRIVLYPEYNRDGAVLSMKGLSGLQPGVYYAILKFEEKIGVVKIFKE